MADFTLYIMSFPGIVYNPHHYVTKAWFPPCPRLSFPFSPIVFLSVQCPAGDN